MGVPNNFLVQALPGQYILYHIIKGMNLANLEKLTTKKKRRLGQGHGSGRVKTSGRGTKGQKARGDVPLDFEGGGLPLIKRMPFLRGKDRNHPRNPRPVVISSGMLNRLPKDTTVNLENLAKYKLVDLKEAKLLGVKLLADGDVQVPLSIMVPVSKAAEEKIKQAGGKVLKIN